MKINEFTPKMIDRFIYNNIKQNIYFIITMIINFINVINYIIHMKIVVKNIYAK